MYYTILNISEFISEKKLNKKRDEVEQEGMYKRKDMCPRCNKNYSECECQEKDPWSTRNEFRIPRISKNDKKEL